MKFIAANYTNENSISLKVSLVNQIKKHVLSNRLNVLVYPLKTIPKVAIQLWYEVGSKDEKDGQRGLAHLLEHMIFKGTDILSESDINLIAHKLSGNCNAFTSHDYTGYLFDFPKQNWKIALPLLANCMRKCTFKEDLLNAELKAVIQELKMYKDDYQSTLCEQMITTLFKEHPYHYPIIGYKQDLWSITQQGLLNFYAKHYVPNNATLVIVGDVEFEETIDLAQKAFGQIPADANYKHDIYNYFPDMRSHTVVIKRDIQQPMVMYAWVVPGLKAKQSHIIDAIRWILGEGKGSRLYKKIVDEQKLATDLQVDLYEMFDQSVFFIHVDPVDQAVIETITQTIATELDLLHKNGINEYELQRAQKQSLMEHLSLFENNMKLAYEIGSTFLSSKNENAVAEYPILQKQIDEQTIDQFIKHYLRSSLMSKGMVLPLDEQELKDWLMLQQQSDKEDERILSRKIRESTVECGIYVEKVVAEEAAHFAYPRAKISELSNGLKLLTHSNKQTPKIDLILDLKVRHFYDPEDKQGLINFMSMMLLEGTEQYPDDNLADAAESRGIGIDIRAGMISISVLKEDFEFALHLLHQLVAKATFPEKSIEKIKGQNDADIAQYWDSPTEFVAQSARSAVYKDHPYHKNILGSKDSIKKINHQDLVTAYKKYSSPYGARLAIVGDLEGINVETIVQNVLGNWQGSDVPDLEFPPLQEISKKDLNISFNRDQTVLCFAGKSVSRFDKQFDALLLFDQIFTGGVLGSMSSYLFQLREQTGLFYTIGGSLVAGADEQPGLVFVRTIVSNDRLQEAERLIEKAMIDCQKLLADVDIEHARNALVNSLVDHFESNYNIAEAFLFLDRFKLPADYFDHRLKTLKAITKNDIEAAVKEILDPSRLIRIRIGRIPLKTPTI
jgi:zinc protease